MGDHDNIFKRAFSVPAHAAGELRSVLPPALTAHIDLSSLQLEPASFIDEEMAQRHADLLFSASIAGRRSLVYFLFEHQSEPDYLMPWRVLTYQHRIWSAWLRDVPTRTTLPAIVTLVVHHGDLGWTAPRRFHEIVDGLGELPELERFVPDFELHIDDLARADDASLLGRPMAPFPKVTLWLLRDGRSVDAFLAHLVAWAAELEGLVQTHGAGEDYVTVLRYIWRVVGDGPKEVVRQRLIDLAPRFGEAMPSYDEELIAKGLERGIQAGIQEGIRQGIEQGRRAGIQEAVLVVLRGRFGVVDAVADKRIADATVEQLERWHRRAIAAIRLEDVFADDE